jgi:hypothetical protein
MKLWKAISLEILIIIAAFGLLQSYYNGLCMSGQHQGAIITSQGVYCWRRLNETYDNFTRLDEIMAILDMKARYNACATANPGELFKCDPGYKDPTPTYEVQI